MTRAWFRTVIALAVAEGAVSPCIEGPRGRGHPAVRKWAEPQAGAEARLMPPDPVYPASHIKRHRATRAEREERLNALLGIAEAAKPATVRQVFYQATVRGIVDNGPGSNRPFANRRHQTGRCLLMPP